MNQNNPKLIKNKQIKSMLVSNKTKLAEDQQATQQQNDVNASLNEVHFTSLFPSSASTVSICGMRHDMQLVNTTELRQ